LFSILLQAQESGDLGLRANLEFSIRTTSQSALSQDTLSISRTNTFRVGPFIPVFTKYKEDGKYREWALTRLEMQFDNDEVLNTNLVSGDEVRRSKVAFELRYELGKFWRYNKWAVGVGLGFGPNFDLDKITPKTSALFPETQISGGVFIELIPRARYYLNDQWFLNIALPGRMVDVAFTFQKVEDPSLEPRQQRQAGFDFGMFGEGLRMTFGVGTIF
ncbi:MAG: hypothetical protein AAFU60_18660, partial [Bacteroidota bacterium]